MQYVDAQLAATGEAPTTWARRHGIAATNLRKWRDGISDPELSTVEQIALALERRPVELLIAAGYVDPADVNITVTPPVAPPNVDEAIETDPRLTDVEREILRTARRMAEVARTGDTRRQSARIKPTRQ